MPRGEDGMVVAVNKLKADLQVAHQRLAHQNALLDGMKAQHKSSADNIERLLRERDNARAGESNYAEKLDEGQARIDTLTAEIRSLHAEKAAIGGGPCVCDLCAPDDSE